MVLLNLVVRKLEDLKAVSEGCLGSLRLTEVVHDSLIRICLLHIAIVEVHYSVPVLKSLPPDFVGEYDFFLSILINALHLAVLPDNLVRHSGVLFILIMVLLRELK